VWSRARIGADAAGELVGGPAAARVVGGGREPAGERRLEAAGGVVARQLGAVGEDFAEDAVLGVVLGALREGDGAGVRGELAGHADDAAAEVVVEVDAAGGVLDGGELAAAVRRGGVLAVVVGVAGLAERFPAGS
jgi:hypothetical protein